MPPFSMPAWTSSLTPLSLRADLLAGVLGAVLVLPQGIAFATLAGLPPQFGLYSAIVPCVVAALAGSSWHVVTGPTNANSLALFAMLAPLAVVGSPTYIELALVVTVLVGLLQLITGALRLGSIANFISPTALLGFTSGAALLIAIHALKDALGLDAPVGLSAAGLLRHMADNILRTNSGALLVALVTLVTAAALRAMRPGSPFMLLGLAAGTWVAFALNTFAHLKWHVSVLGVMGSPVPPWRVPEVPWNQMSELIAIASSLAVVALAQSISIAKAVADRSGQRIDANREFIGQGLANIAGGFFSSYVSCGSLNRSIPNLEAGARTPLAAILSAILLIPLVFLSAPVLTLIPFASIAGLLWLVAWTLLDLPRWKRLARSSTTELGVALLTFIATVAVRLELAVLVGSALSLGLYLQRTSRPALRTIGFAALGGSRPFVVLEDATVPPRPECPQLKMLRVEGSIYFGATAHVSDHLQTLREAPQPPRHLLIMARSMNFLDVAGAELWRQELRARRALGGDLYFHHPRPQVVSQWQRDGFLEALGADHIFEDKSSAIQAIYQRMDPDICSKCQARVLRECGGER